MQKIKTAVRQCYDVIENNTGKVVASVGTAAMTLATQVHAALPESVDTALTATQTDVLAMIGKGFVYLGATAGLMVVLGVFVKILRKGKG